MSADGGIHKPFRGTDPGCRRIPTYRMRSGDNAIKTAAVTGTSGFVGRCLGQALEGNSVRVRRLGRREQPGVCTIDYKDQKSLTTALDGVDIVYHVAGLINGSTASLVEANLTTTRAMVEAAARVGSARFVLISSAAASTERGEYGRIKKEAEEALCASGLPYVIFRPTLIYGPGDHKNVASMARVVRFSPVVPVLGGGGFEIQPIHIDDVLSVLLQCMNREIRESIYNLSGPEQISMLDMLHLLAKSMGRTRLFVPVPLKPVQVALRAYHRVIPWTRLPVKQIAELNKHRAFDISLTRRDFDFDPIRFAEGIRRTVQSEGW